MNFVQPILTTATNLVSPSYHSQNFTNFSRNYYWQYIRTGSFKPVVHIMVAVGVLGYAAEYFPLGRGHALHKYHVVQKALEEDAKKGHH